jgi:hypothetical protein
MIGSQLPLFQRKTYKGIAPSIPMDISAPAEDMTVLQTLPAYYTYLKDGGCNLLRAHDGLRSQRHEC